MHISWNISLMVLNYKVMTNLLKLYLNILFTLMLAQCGSISKVRPMNY